MERNDKKCKCEATGKRKYYTIGEALNDIIRLKQKNKFKLDNVKRTKRGKGKSALRRAYFCPNCKCYHITSMAVYKKKDDQKRPISNLVCNESDFFVRKWKENSIPFPTEKS